MEKENFQIIKKCCEVLPILYKSTNDFNIFFQIKDKLIDYGNSQSGFKRRIFMEIMKNSFSCISFGYLITYFFSIFSNIKNERFFSIKIRFLEFVPTLLQKIYFSDKSKIKYIKDILVSLIEGNDKSITFQANEICSNYFNFDSNSNLNNDLETKIKQNKCIEVREDLLTEHEIFMEEEKKIFELELKAIKNSENSLNLIKSVGVPVKVN